MARLKTTIALAALLGGALVALLAGPAGLRLAHADEAAPAQPAAAEAKAEDTELAKQMEVIEDGMKKLRRTLRGAEGNADSLKTIGAMQAAAVASKELTPVMAAKVPEADRQEFLTDYRKEMVGMIGELCQMELAVLDGNHEKAQEIHKKLKDVEEAGHEKFTQE